MTLRYDDFVNLVADHYGMEDGYETVDEGLFSLAVDAVVAVLHEKQRRLGVPVMISDLTVLMWDINEVLEQVVSPPEPD